MNFLAHLYLSGEDDQIKLGNFIGDYVKGSKYNAYPEKIRKGILLHRKIDSFTDSHPLIREASLSFRKYYKRYSGIVVDLVFDHFLAQNWDNYSNDRLKNFTRNAHAIFLTNFLILPARVKKFLPFLIQSKRLESYATEKGLVKALELMAHYTSLPNQQKHVMPILNLERSDLFQIFNQFMIEIIQYIENEEGIRIYLPDRKFS